MNSLTGTPSDNYVETSESEGPFIFTMDNIFLDVARSLPDNTFLTDNGIKPGSQNTATTEQLKNVA